MFDELRRSPMLKKALAAGEERVGKVVAAVLSNERVMARVQGAVTTALEARAAVEKGVKSALHAVNLPTGDEVAELKRRIAELEAMIDGLAARVDRETGASAAPPADGAPPAQDPPAAP